MGHTLVMVALLAVVSVQVIECGHYNPSTPTAQPEDEDPQVYVLIPLPDTYNMTTQWLGLLRDSYIHIIRFEASQRVQTARQVSNSVLLMADTYKLELDSLVVEAVEKDRPCVEKHTELGLQVFQTMDGELKSCSKTLVDLIDRYDQQLDAILKKVAAMDEAQIYSKCLPVEERLTRKILERSEMCFREEYRQAVDSVYYPTGLDLFTLATQMSRSFLDVEMSARDCGVSVLSSHDGTLTKILEDIRHCAKRVTLPGYEPHSRERRSMKPKRVLRCCRIPCPSRRYCRRMRCPCPWG